MFDDPVHTASDAVVPRFRLLSSGCFTRPVCLAAIWLILRSEAGKKLSLVLIADLSIALEWRR